MDNKCIECENSVLLDFSDLSIRYDELEKENKLLNECLDVKEELNKVYRDKIDSLKRKIECLER